MQNTKLAGNLMLLDSKGLSNFGKFINSPYFIERKQIPLLFKHLKNYAPSYSVSKEKLYSEVFPGKKYNDQLMRKYISETNRIFERFAAIRSFERDKYAYELCRAGEKSRLNLYEEVKKTSAALIRNLKDQQVPGEEQYYYLYKFGVLHDEAASFSMNSSGRMFAEQTISGFIDYSAIMTLKYYSRLLNNRKYVNIDSTDKKLLDELVNIYYMNGKVNNPLVKIYYNIIRSIIDKENTGYYYSLKSLLYKNEHYIHGSDLRGFYIYLHNYCYEKADHGNMEFVKERNEIMLKFLNNGYCFEKGIMKPEFFSSMILNTLTLHKLKYAEEFYHKYSSSLPEENRISLLNFTMANITMRKKQYSKALGLLGKIKYNDVFDNIRTRTLYIMIYFESAMYEPLKYQTDSFRHFLKNSKNITSYINTRCLNFLKEIRKMVQYKEKGLQTGYSNDLEGKIVMNRSWLMEKIKEIDNTM